MGAAITKACNCKCAQQEDEDEINRENNDAKNPDSVDTLKKKHKETDPFSTIGSSSSDKNNNTDKKNQKYNNHSNKDLSIIKEQQYGEFGIDLDEPTIEIFNKNPYSGNQNNTNSKYHNPSQNNNNSNYDNNNPNLNNNHYGNDNNQNNSNSNFYTNNTNPNNNSNINSNPNYKSSNKKSNKYRNPNEINRENEDDIYIQNSNNKKINKNTLKIFNVPLNKSTIHNYNINNTEKSFHSKLNKTGSNQNDSILHLNHSLNNTINQSLIINGIHKLNEIFHNIKEKNKNDEINYIWQNLDINTFISSKKLNSNDPEEIMFKGTIYKMVLSNIFKNCSMNIQKFCILTKKKFFIYQNKENFLLMKNPQRVIKLEDIESCGRIDLTLLNIHYLYEYYYMYIEVVDDEYDKKELNNDEVYKIVKKEQSGRFFLLFSKDESILNQWVCAINFIINSNQTQ